jgi:hypothetical protein
MPTLAPATAAPVSAETTRPATMPGVSAARSGDANAAQAARTRNDGKRSGGNMSPTQRRRDPDQRHCAAATRN